jgi:hypothetical protein
MPPPSTTVVVKIGFKSWRKPTKIIETSGLCSLSAVPALSYGYSSSFCLALKRTLATLRNFRSASLILRASSVNQLSWVALVAIGPTSSLASDRHGRACRRIKQNAEGLRLNSTSHDKEPHNAAFTVSELLTSW